MNLNTIKKIFGLIFVLSLVGGSTQAQNPSYTISANQLFKEYDDNEVAADDKFKQKIILVSGIINDIGKDIMDNPYIVMGGDGVNGVQSTFNDDQISVISKLSKGQYIFVKGEVTGKIMGSVQIGHAIIVTSNNSSQNSNKIILGGIFPMTGGAASFGQSSKNGMQMAIDEFNATTPIVNGKKVTVKACYEDDEGQPEKAANAGLKLINQDKVTGIIGCIMSKNSLVVAPIAQRAQVPMISPTSTNPMVTEEGDFIFRACFIDPFQGTVMANFAYNTLGSRKAAVLFDNGNAYNEGLAEFFIKGFEQLGGEIVSEEAFTDEDKTVDYKAQLTNIKAKNPDFLYIPNYYQSAALIMKQSKEIGLNVKYGGGDGWDSPELVNIGGAAVEGGFFSNHFSKDDQRPIVQNFVQKYEAKFTNAPGAVATLAYDATQIFLRALVSVNSTNGTKIRDAIKATNSEFLTGNVSFDENRNPIKSAVVMTIKNGQQKYIKNINPSKQPPVQNEGDAEGEEGLGD